MTQKAPRAGRRRLRLINRSAVAPTRTAATTIIRRVGAGSITATTPGGRRPARREERAIATSLRAGQR